MCLGEYGFRLAKPRGELFYGGGRITAHQVEGGTPWKMRHQVSLVSRTGLCPRPGLENSFSISCVVGDKLNTKKVLVVLE